MKNIKDIHPEIKLLNKLLFFPQGIKIKNIHSETESQEYLAHEFQLNGQNIKFRKAKITPTKTGQFVTIWKRNEKGITAPFSILDDIHFFIIMTQKEELCGVFIFPKTELHKNKILSDVSKDGKRGIRVYPPWDSPTNKQAKKSQDWQTKFFIDFTNDKKVYSEKAIHIIKASIDL